MQNKNLLKRLLDMIPKDSIGRYDLLPVFRDTELFTDIIKDLAAPYMEAKKKFWK